MAATFSYAAAAKGLAPTPTPELNEQKPESSPETSTEAVTSDTETPRETENTAASTEKESEPAAVASANPDVSGTSSPSAGTTSKDEESSNAPNGTSESTWDKQSQASGSEKPNGRAEGAKEKSDSTAEKEKPAPPPKELKAAPLPAVNIWHQRKEAHDAKAKAIASLKPAVTKNGAAKAGSTASSISGDNQQELSRAASKKKGADAAAKKSDKGREDDANLPPVGDAALWPTPQVAQGEEKKKAQEKTEKTEKTDKNAAARSHGKEKWMPVPYVPTAVFNTPLPSSGRRGGGRPARGGREGGRNGGHGAGAAAAAEKAPAGQVAQNGVGKQAASAERGRGEPNTARANSLPANARRSNSAEAGKAAPASRGPKGTEEVNGAPAGKHTNGDFPRHHGKGFAKNQESGPHKGNGHLSVDARAHRFENGPKSADFAGFHGDRDHHKDTKEHHRESRADRGRGSHRGRGGHAGFGGQNSQFPNSHMSHHSFVHPKSFGFPDRQRSQHGLPNGSQGHRMSLRSPSLPNSASMYGVYPFPAEINTMYGYQPVQAGPMTAVPYQQYMEPFSLMSMISMQLEYYFSVDNLCKDLFLRKHMDSQGYVNLAFIASFKRIKTLTEDYELLRHVSRQLRNVEYHASEDGVDRLRPRDKWEQWVFPIDQRDPSAQNEGPLASKPEESHNHVNGLTNGSALPNGTSEPRLSKTPLSSAAPEFSPSKAIPSQDEITNVWTPFEPHPFPDSQVEKLVIVARRSTSPRLPRSSFLRPLTPSCLPNGSVDAFRTAGGIDTPKNPLLPCPRTSAAVSSSQGMNPAQPLSNTPYYFTTVGVVEANSSLPLFWVTEKNTPIEFLHSDFVHESYNVFRKRALEKRNLTATQEGNRDMDVLYQFWSHFLVQNFNAQMYNDFRSLALDDYSARNASNGFNRLIHFYGASLSSNKVLPDEVVQDLVDFGREESTSPGKRMVFRTLRSAWRSRSFNPRSRKKIDCVLDASLRAELEK